MLDGLFILISDLLWPNKARPEPRAEDGMLQAEGNLRQLVGKSGITQTALHPSGKVTIEGRSYDARTEGGFIRAGEPVEVVGVRQVALIVRPVD